MSAGDAVRPSGTYADFEGDTYEAGYVSTDPAGIILYAWGPRPAVGFQWARFDKRRGEDLWTRRGTQAELDRLYRLTVLCGYLGGGPFRVNAVGPDDGGSPMLHTTYVGDDREWALGQPGCEPNQMPMGAMEAREVWGHFRLDEVDFLRENIEDIRVTRRRRRRAATP